MTEQEKNTEEKIMHAATNVFIQKGKAASRMQEIADEAGINKALLHYYYRSKDKLFEAVFKLVLSQLVVPTIVKTLESEEDVFVLIEKFVEIYNDLLMKNPFIPLFIIEEINKNPEWFNNTLFHAGLPTNLVIAKIQAAMDEGKIRVMDPKQIIVNLISLSVFPFAARAIIQPVLFENSKKDLKQFLASRKKEVSSFIIHSIKL